MHTFNCKFLSSMCVFPLCLHLSLSLLCGSGWGHATLDVATLFGCLVVGGAEGSGEFFASVSVSFGLYLSLSLSLSLYLVPIRQ